jgi:hypothetical protein
MHQYRFLSLLLSMTLVMAFATLMQPANAQGTLTDEPKCTAEGASDMTAESIRLAEAATAQ